jgi:predicted secreted protein
MSKTQLPESQRRAVLRTALILAAIAGALFVYTLWRGMK